MLEGLGAPVSLALQTGRESRADLAVFPENRQALHFFLLMQTQWRVGMGGREGLIYSEAFRLMDEIGVQKRKHRQALFNDLREMEGEALKVWAEEAERRQQQERRRP